MVDLLILWIICRGASKSNKKQITRNKQETDKLQRARCKQTRNKQETNKKSTNNNLKEKLLAFKIYILIIRYLLIVKGNP